MAGYIDNNNLNVARVRKVDEFYTRLIDIEKELQYYQEHFIFKNIFSNCDNEESKFVEFFENVKYPLEYAYAGFQNNIKGRHDVDFRGKWSLGYLKEADIVVTNPPFSLFKEFFDLLIQFDKRFIIIGNLNAITQKVVFNLFKENKIWTGINQVRNFINDEGDEVGTGAGIWYTNLKPSIEKKKLILTKEYDEKLHPRYDNYDAINCNSVYDIPIDYFKPIGVPITYINKYDPEEFEILDLLVLPKLNGIKKYKRIIIKRILK